MKTINPATGETIKEYELMDDEEISSIIKNADAAQQQWAKKSFRERAKILNRIAAALEDQKEEVAELMAREMGKPLPQGQSEAEKCAWVCKYYAEHAADFLQDESIQTDASESFVTFPPVGTVLAIMPWNFPFWQLFRFGAPALMAGNAAVLKHAPNVTGCALKIESILHDAGIPETLFRTIIADIDQTQQVIENNHIQAVTLTGSVRAGKAVAKKAGGELKKTVLELGGSDPSIILKDADLEKAAESCVNSRLNNSGQSCIAAKRFIVVQDVYDDFLSAVKEKMKIRRMGDPLRDENINIGPMAREDLRDELHEQVAKSIDAGAVCLMGGKIPERKGFFYPPTILENVQRGMPAYEEELFGPVASFIQVSDEEEAINIANDTSYGLGASVYSKNAEHAREIAAKKLQAGCCFVNDFVKSDPRLPFGGIKNSGYGRELSYYGIKEFVNKKTVYVA
ncbi:MAG TPA: NAD-dependent succinate-semialdehyde dehydrogenase [Balneolaceae bacterium]|nr:NAD-dependent succinate-semialdehyde dehydrogenase [Balneolaceae bacterium]